MNNYQKACEYIKNSQKNNLGSTCCIYPVVGPTGPQGVIGPTGPAGPASITIEGVQSLDPGSEPEVVNLGNDDDVRLMFMIPSGMPGINGATGPQGEIGPTGPAGTSVTILGYFPTEEDLNQAVPEGNPGDSYLVGGDLYVWSDNTKSWENVGRIQGPPGNPGLQGEIGPTGPQGIQGPQGIPGPQGLQGETGPAGPEKLKVAYLITYNQLSNPLGLQVQSGERININNLEMQSEDIVTLNNDGTFNFNLIGYYHVSFMVSAYHQASGPFNPDTDFVSAGLRIINTDNIYVGDSKFTNDNIPVELYGEGVITVNDTNNKFEIVNIGLDSIYLKSPYIGNLTTNSYFANPLVRVIVEYLGVQST